MAILTPLDIPLALNAKCETGQVDFKRSFDPGVAADWLELTKDVVAMANSGGGMILIGINDDGTPSGADLAPLARVDPAEITDKVARYTDTQVVSFRLIEERLESNRFLAILIDGVDVPIVFTRPGTYLVENNRQKTAFGIGTVYFRHGAKSEPADSHDLRRAFDRLLDSRRSAWMEGIQRVVEAPPGARVAILSPDQISGEPTPVSIRLTTDPRAPEWRSIPIDQTHPFRQKELVREVNKQLQPGRSVTAFDIVCIRRVHDVQKNPLFCYTLNFASPQYSTAFLDWIVSQCRADPGFLDRTRESYYVLKQDRLRDPSRDRTQDPGGHPSS